MDVLGLYSGTKSWEKPFIEGGHNVETLDILPEFNCTYTMDALNFIPKKRYKVVIGSPPCTYFSQARNAWKNTPKATTPEQIALSIKWFSKVISVIQAVHADYFLIENPSHKNGARLYFPHFDNPSLIGPECILPEKIHYCMYGFPHMKPTDLWTNIPLDFRKCNHKRSEHKSFQLTHGSKSRSIIPTELTNHVYNIVMELVNE